MKTCFLLLICLFLTACLEKEAQEEKPLDKVEVDQPVLKACTKELKICPDGSGVGRNSENNCEFNPCPKLAAKKKGEPMMCTQEVKQCPDGSFVGRDSNNNCAFKPCPEVSGNLQ